MTALALLGAGPVVAQDARLALDGPRAAAELVGVLEVLEDPGAALTPEAALRSGAFVPSTEAAPHFGYTKSRVWMRLALANVTEDVRDWRLVFTDDLLEEFTVWAAPPSGAPEILVDLDWRAPFWERPVPHGKLVAPLRLAPGEETVVLVRYWSRGLSATGMRIETADGFAARTAARATRNAVFYGMAAALICIALLGFATQRQVVFLAWAGYVTAVLVHIMKMDGAAFQYFWPFAPGFNDFAPMLIGASVYFWAAIYARTFLRTAELHPRLDLLWRGVALLALALLVGAFFLDRQVITGILTQMGPPAALLMVASGLIAARTRFREVRFFLLAWACAFLAAGTGALRMLGVDISPDLSRDIQRFWLILDAMLMGLAIADSVRQQRQAAQAVTAEALAQAERSLVISRRMAELEDAYATVASVGRAQAERIRETVHDLRQPLGALRLRVRDLSGASDGEIAELESSFAYVERLIAEQAALVERPDGGPPPLPHDAAPDLSLGAALEAVADMFSTDAEARGLALRAVPTSAEVDVPPLVVMRCLSNLVSNAVRYTSSGRVLIGVRRRGTRVRVEVHDTGLGLSSGDFARAMERDVRLESGCAEGQGLGLAIVADLACRHGLTLLRLPSCGGGLSVALEMPAAGGLHGDPR